MSDHTSTVVCSRPNCDFCGGPADIDGKTNMGPWASMCNFCHSLHGVGLGLGRGQRLVVK